MKRFALIEARGSRSQSCVAKDLGISQKYLSKLELGQRNPSIRTAIKLSRYYGKEQTILFADIFGV